MLQVEAFLADKVWVVVGASNNKDKYGYKLFKFLKGQGLEVYPVNPGVTEVLGETCYPTLSQLPKRPEAVDVVVPPRVSEQILRDCALLGIKHVWLQPGAEDQQNIALAEQLGLEVIHHACLMVEWRKQQKQ